MHALFEQQKAEWEYLKTPEYRNEVLNQMVDSTTEDITPPWEED